VSNTSAITPARAIRIGQVCDRTGASRATIWRWVKGDPSFPRPFKLSEGVTVWDEGEVGAWVAFKRDTVRGGQAPLAA
jgi:prophage regulatory protein